MIGLAIGKFNPPHLGHHHLINSALKQVDELDVLIVTWKGEEIPAALRAEWLREIHPGIRTRLLDQDSFDKDIAGHWASATLVATGRKPDLIFSSEDYGEYYAELLGCAHVMVDKGRVTVPCSATEIRSDPQRYFRYLNPLVQKYFS